MKKSIKRILAQALTIALIFSSIPQRALTQEFWDIDFNAKTITIKGTPPQETLTQMLGIYAGEFSKAHITPRLKRGANTVVGALSDQPSQVSIGTVGFIIGSVIQCFGKATFSKDKILYKGCVDSLTEFEQSMGLVVFSVVSGITTSALQSVLANPNSMAMWQYVKVNSASKKVRIKAATKLFVARHMLSGFGMTAGSVGQHYFSKWYQSEESTKYLDSRWRELGYWKTRWEEVDSLLAQAKEFLNGSKENLEQLKASVQKLVDVLQKDLDLMPQAPTNDKPSLAQMMGDKSITAFRAVLTTLKQILATPVEKWKPSEKYLESQLATTLRSLKDLYPERIERSRKLKDEFFAQAWAKMWKMAPHEAEELGASTAAMIITSLVTAVAETMTYRVIGKTVKSVASGAANGMAQLQNQMIAQQIEQGLPNLAEVVTEYSKLKKIPAGEAKALLDKVTVLSEAEKFVSVKEMLRQILESQWGSKLKKALPTFVAAHDKTKTAFALTKEERIYSMGTRWSVFDVKNFTFRFQRASPEFLAAKAEVEASGRKWFLLKRKWTLATFMAAVNAVWWLSINDQIHDPYIAFGYEQKIFGLDVSWIVPEIELLGLKKYETKVAEAKDKAVRAIVAAVENSDAEAAKIIAKEKADDGDQAIDKSDAFAEYISKTPPTYRAAMKAIQDFDNVFKTYVDKVRLASFNKNFKEFEAQYHKYNDKKYQMTQYLLWQKRIAARSAEEKAKDPQGYTDLGFRFNGSSDIQQVSKEVGNMKSNPDSPLYQQIPGKPWHKDADLFRKSFEDEMEGLKKEIQSLRFEPADFEKARVQPGVYVPQDFTSYMVQKAKNIFAPKPEFKDHDNLISLIEAKHERETTERVMQFQIYMSDAIDKLMPTRVYADAPVPLGPIEENIELEFSHLRDIIYKASEMIAAKYPHLVKANDVLGQLYFAVRKSEVKKFNSSFYSDGLVGILNQSKEAAKEFSPEFLNVMFGVKGQTESDEGQQQGNEYSVKSYGQSMVPSIISQYNPGSDVHPRLMFTDPKSKTPIPYRDGALQFNLVENLREEIEKVVDALNTDRVKAQNQKNALFRKLAQKMTEWTNAKNIQSDEGTKKKYDLLIEQVTKLVAKINELDGELEKKQKQNDEELKAAAKAMTMEVISLLKRYPEMLGPGLYAPVPDPEVLEKAYMSSLMGDDGIEGPDGKQESRIAPPMTQEAAVKERIDIMAHSLGLAINNLRSQFIDVPKMKRYVYELDFKTMIKCDGIRGTNIAFNRSQNKDNALAMFNGVDQNMPGSCWDLENIGRNPQK